MVLSYQALNIFYPLVLHKADKSSLDFLRHSRTFAADGGYDLNRPRAGKDFFKRGTGIFDASRSDNINLSPGKSKCAITKRLKMKRRKTARLF